MVFWASEIQRISETKEKAMLFPSFEKSKIFQKI